MNLIGNNFNDDYKNDIKPDQTVTPLGDAFSSIAWAPNHNQIFATTSWDGDLRIFEVANSFNYGTAITQKMTYKFPSPALKCTWNDTGTHIYVGLMDGSIKAFDIGSSQTMDIGRHALGISSLHYVANMNTVISTSFETNVQFWQIGNQNPVLTLNAEQKIFASDFQYPILVAGTANQKIFVVDINNSNMRSIVDSNDLGKNSQIQSIAINPKCNTFGIASIDGRANLSSITKNVNGLYNPKSIITFKSNKHEEGGNTILYPVNAVSFNPVNERWFITAGSDGGMHFWDYQAKNKIKTLNYGGIPICCAKVNSAGNMIAYGLGNDWHIGIQGNKWTPQLGVHVVAENQTKFQK